MDQAGALIVGQEHWTHKGDVKLFLWEKRAVALSRGPACGDATAEACQAPDVTTQSVKIGEQRAHVPLQPCRGTIIFVHGSSMASTPAFDLPLPGNPDASLMEWFAQRGFDTWCVDMEGYGRSSKHRDINCDIANGADDLAAATDYIMQTRGTKKFFMYGSSSGGLRAAKFAERHPGRVSRLALDAFVWTGRGSPTLAERTKKLPQWLASNRRRIDRAFVQSIFTRDHGGGAEQSVIDAYADAILALDDSVPTGTYVDMCSKLPVVDPAKLNVAVLIMRGQFDGIASTEDLLDFYARLPHPDKQFAVMPGIAHNSTKQANYRIAYHILLSFFTQPEPIYQG